ncbi:SDR family oxidoreductase [Sporolactobacillus sp. CQH2019]|uniref:SDR family NAD(P)-dependent oxidoreductase n=1 Tax=Sporolactobacillus sp. CQH2019 TaxID=3023512 RepID=UPI002367BAC1|nr:SDR family oxidoreductase [Sporolactobacillus sp. CQH2019]MDD9150591.1 SDR family oxidoreductase [Sporolactobacillus sp. CQH2019]
MNDGTKIALVTGGSRGLGKSTALALAKKGVDVIVTYNSQKEKADAVVDEIENSGRKAAALQLDVGETALHHTFAAQLSEVLKSIWNRGRFDFLINNAGFAYNAPFAETTEEQFDSMMRVHFKGVYFLTQNLLPQLVDHGRIINFSSGLARFTTPGWSAYAAMKGAVEVMTRYMAKELGPRGIRVNTVAPGIIDTDFHHGALDAVPGIKEQIGTQITLGRIGRPDDIGGIVASLCRDEMGWITGERIEASGGMFL